MKGNRNAERAAKDEWTVRCTLCFFCLFVSFIYLFYERGGHFWDHRYGLSREAALKAELLPGKGGDIGAARAGQEEGAEED